MKVRNANKVLDKTEFNNQADWETYPTADYTCDNCKQTISLSFKNLTKHVHNNFSNLSDIDRQNVDKTIQASVDNVPLSILDFYYPICKRPVCVYYDTWAGGHHGEMGYNLKYIVD